MITHHTSTPQERGERISSALPGYDKKNRIIGALHHNDDSTYCSSCYFWRNTRLGICPVETGLESRNAGRLAALCLAQNAFVHSAIKGDHMALDMGASHTAAFNVD